ncbi:sulfotransferase family protein [Rubrobacter tropicus]|uniref:sulfotransferase family protein n=1 Tax=Rubrobacter tropicus TaxID=2653851 RepID=UPI00140AC378|nr:sulfotransferase family protein [Rubrobacter tropicus]
MKVVGAGFGRTGTKSLQAALEELGFGPCYHMTELFEHPEHAETWEAARRGEPVDWDGFLGDYEAAVDWPACTFYEELMERYPDAKVLLSVRDPDRWYESVCNTIYELSRLTVISPLSRPTFRLVGLFVPAIGKVSRMNNRLIWEDTFDGKFEDREYAKAIFERHNADVRRRVSPEKLLVYEVKDGWDPLCDFLGVEVPGKPFPRLNDTAEMRSRVRAVRAVSLAVPAVLALLAGGLYLTFSRLSRQPRA